MTLEYNSTDPLSAFIKYLAVHDPGSAQSLPALSEISKKLDISVAILREQLEVARALGLVDVRPRKGIRKLPYKFSPTVKISLAYALKTKPSRFEEYSDLRIHIEEAFWYEAVEKLTEKDMNRLDALISKAWIKLNGNPIQIPHDEHRELHLAIYSQLNNEFVNGLLETYWDAYESIGLNVYTGLSYLQEVWKFHEQMVDAIRVKNYELGFQLLRDHTDLLYHRPENLNR